MTETSKLAYWKHLSPKGAIVIDGILVSLVSWLVSMPIVLYSMRPFGKTNVFIEACPFAFWIAMFGGNGFVFAPLFAAPLGIPAFILVLMGIMKSKRGLAIIGLGIYFVMWQWMTFVFRVWGSLS